MLDFAMPTCVLSASLLCCSRRCVHETWERRSHTSEGAFQASYAGARTRLLSLSVEEGSDREKSQGKKHATRSLVKWKADPRRPLRHVLALPPPPIADAVLGYEMRRRKKSVGRRRDGECVLLLV